MRVTFKYNYTLLENGKISTFKAGESKDFPDESTIIETFRQQDGIVLTIEKEIKKVKSKSK